MIIIVANITCYDRIKTVRVKKCLFENDERHEKCATLSIKEGENYSV